MGFQQLFKELHAIQAELPTFLANQNQKPGLKKKKGGNHLKRVRGQVTTLGPSPGSFKVTVGQAKYTPAPFSLWTDHTCNANVDKL